MVSEWVLSLKVQQGFCWEGWGCSDLAFARLLVALRLQEGLLAWKLLRDDQLEALAESARPYFGPKEFPLIAAKAEVPAQEVGELYAAQVIGIYHKVVLEVSYAFQCADWHDAGMAGGQMDL